MLIATAPHPASAMALASPPALGCAPLSLSSPALQRSRTVPRCWHQARAGSAATPGWHAVPAGLAPQLAQPALLTSRALCIAVLRGCPHQLVTACCVVHARVICKHCLPITLQFYLSTTFVLLCLLCHTVLSDPPQAQRVGRDPVPLDRPTRANAHFRECSLPE